MGRRQSEGTVLSPEGERGTDLPIHPVALDQYGRYHVVP